MNIMKSLVLTLSTCTLLACGGSGGSDSDNNSSSELSLSKVAGVWSNGSNNDSYTVIDATGLQGISKRTPTPSITPTPVNTDCYDIGRKISLNQVADGKFEVTDGGAISGNREIQSVTLVRNADALTATYQIRETVLNGNGSSISTVTSVETMYPTNLNVTDIQPVCDSQQ